jgi:cytochrome c556
MMRSILVIVSLGVALALPSAAQDVTPEERAAGATATRQAVFKLLGFNMGPIGGMAREMVEFDAAIAERNARRIAALAPMIPELFAAMDTREFDVRTLALPIIWDNTDEFADLANKLIEAANDFADIAAGGDQAATLAAVRSLGGGCGNCHERFREEVD